MHTTVKRMVNAPGVYVAWVPDDRQTAIIVSQQARLFSPSGYSLIDPELIQPGAYEGPYCGHPDPKFSARRQDDDGSEIKVAEAPNPKLLHDLGVLIAAVRPLLGRSFITSQEWDATRLAVNTAISSLS